LELLRKVPAEVFAVLGYKKRLASHQVPDLSTSE
jgi:hypothetical protein